MMIVDFRKDNDRMFFNPFIVGFLTSGAILGLVLFCNFFNTIFKLDAPMEYNFSIMIWFGIVGFALFFLYWNFDWKFKVDCALCNHSDYKDNMIDITCNKYREYHGYVFVCKRHRMYIKGD